MAIENWNRWVFPLKMVIFHSYINVYRRVIYWRLPGKAKKWQWRCAFRPPVTSCDAVFMDTPVAPGMSSPCSYRVKSVNMTYPNPIFPIFFLYSKIHEKSHFTILFWPSTSPSFFFFGLDGMISCSFLENPHLPHTIHVFYWADTREKWSNLNL